jgi:hypothetical protein
MTLQRIGNQIDAAMIFAGGLRKRVWGRWFLRFCLRRQLRLDFVQSSIRFHNRQPIQGVVLQLDAVPLLPQP